MMHNLYVCNLSKLKKTPEITKEMCEKDGNTSPSSLQIPFRSVGRLHVGAILRQKKKKRKETDHLSK